MARIAIDITGKLIFETTIVIKISDINYGNHVGHDAFISLLHEARIRFLKSLGFSEANISGKALIVSDLAVSYKSQAFYGDKLKFEVGAGDFNKYGCDIFYKVSNTETDELILQAKTGIVFFDYKMNKIITMPENFKRVIGDDGIPTNKYSQTNSR